MSSREQRALIARETLEIIEKGFYTNSQGEVINIKEACLAAENGSIHYTSSMLNNVLAKRDRLYANLKNPVKTNFIVTNETTLQAASRLVNQEGIERVLCLNFASAKNPGGGFLNGSQAQEESLARATGLYPCIAQMIEMYETNKNNSSCLYTDDMIYSPGVPVFRDDNDRLLDRPFLISIITAPAVNAGTVKRQEVEYIESTMLERTEKLLSVAAIHNYKALVLGAWGCGVFKNNPEDVARYFYQHLVENPKINSLFKKIIFAVLDNSRNEATIEPFRELFGQTENNY